MPSWICGVRLTARLTVRHRLRRPRCTLCRWGPLPRRLLTARSLASLTIRRMLHYVRRCWRRLGTAVCARLFKLLNYIIVSCRLWRNCIKMWRRNAMDAQAEGRRIVVERAHNHNKWRRHDMQHMNHPIAEELMEDKAVRRLMEQHNQLELQLHEAQKGPVVDWDGVKL